MGITKINVQSLGGKRQAFRKYPLQKCRKLVKGIFVLKKSLNLGDIILKMEDKLLSA